MLFYLFIAFLALEKDKQKDFLIYACVQEVIQGHVH